MSPIIIQSSSNLAKIVCRCSFSLANRTLSSASLGQPQQRIIARTPNVAQSSRLLTTSRACLIPSDDPGGKPNDGSHPTVYDDFKNITASDEPSLSIHSMGTSSFTLSDGLVVHTPLILLNKQILLWDAPQLLPTPERPVMPSGMGWEEWNEDLWRVFEVVSPRPEIIVFGTGKTVLPPPPKIKAYLNKLGIQVEAHDSRNACQTYNLLVEEGRLVAAAMIPVQRKPTEKVKAIETKT